MHIFVDKRSGCYCLIISCRHQVETMAYLLFIGSFNAFFFLALLLQKRPKQFHDRILSFWLLYLGLATFLYGITKEFFSLSPIANTAVIALFLLHGPFLYLYVSGLTLSKKHFKTKDLFHFVPFISFIIYLLIASGFPNYSAGITVDHLSEDIVKPPVLFLFFLGLTAISGPIYFYLSYQKFQKSKDSLLNYSSQEINLDWLGKLIYIFGIVWTGLIVIAIAHHIFHFFSIDFCINGLFLSLAAFIILIGYFGFKQKDIFISFSSEADLEIPAEPEIKYAATKMEGTELNQCCNTVSHFMKTNRPYLDSDLTLPKLADELKVSTHHLSQVINEVHGKNFFNFINLYRVEEVKRKIQDPKYKDYSLLGIAYESGFNSKSAFNRVFKNITGTTPSNYRDSLTSS